MRFFSSFFAREDRFFGLLRSSANNLTEVSALLVDLMDDYQNVKDKVAEIKRLEEVGDHIIHEIMRNLHLTFVTPLDREDIALLGERLDDVVDSIEETARLMVEYQIPEPTEEAKALARIIVKAAETLQEAIGKLHFRGSKLKSILPDAVEINRLEKSELDVRVFTRYQELAVWLLLPALLMLLGELALDETLTSRETVNVKLRDVLDEATDKWGVKVNRVELKNIEPPVEIQDAMAKQMKGKNS